MKDVQNSILINTYRIIKATNAEGPGIRLCVWFQGCSRHCDGCYAADTWSHKTNKLISVDEIKSMLAENQSTEGITVLGGEPFEQPEQLLSLVKTAKELNRSTIVFTGYTLKELHLENKPYITEILNNTDVLIDGAYDKNKRSFDSPLIGSSNQNFHFLTERYSMSDFEKNKIELIIDKNGIIRINGMCDFEKLYRNGDL